MKKSKRPTQFQITKVTPVEFFLDYDMLMHEAATMKIISRNIINYTTFSSLIYQHTFQFLFKPNHHNMSVPDACIRVLLASTIKNVFQHWPKDELKDFIKNSSEQVKWATQMEQEGKVNFDEDYKAAIKKLRENDEVKKSGNIWKAVTKEAYEIMQNIIIAKNAQNSDPGIWKAINDCASSLN